MAVRTLPELDRLTNGEAAQLLLMMDSARVQYGHQLNKRGASTDGMYEDLSYLTAETRRVAQAAARRARI